MQTCLSGLADISALPPEQAEIVGTHVRYLDAALRTSENSLFLDYVAWANVVRATAPGNSPEAALRALTSELNQIRSAVPDSETATAELLDQAIQRLGSRPVDLSTTAEPLPADAQHYLDALLDGNVAAAREIVFTSLDAGRSLRDLYLNVFQRSQHEVGRLWQINRISVAQEHFCTAATQQIMTELYPRIFANGRGFAEERPGIVAVNASGDQHQIGIRMIADLLELHGWDTCLLPAGAAAEEVVAALAKRKAKLLAISVTMSYYLPRAMDLIATVRAKLPAVRILVGGYPFNVTANLWRSVGADAMARDAAQAVEQAEMLFGGSLAS